MEDGCRSAFGGSSGSTMLTASFVTSSRRGSPTTIWAQQQRQLSSLSCVSPLCGSPKLSHCSGASTSQANNSVPVISSRNTATNRKRAIRVIHPRGYHGPKLLLPLNCCCPPAAPTYCNPQLLLPPVAGVPQLLLPPVAAAFSYWSPQLLLPPVATAFSYWSPSVVDAPCCCCLQLLESLSCCCPLMLLPSVTGVPQLLLPPVAAAFSYCSPQLLLPPVAAAFSYCSPPVAAASSCYCLQLLLRPKVGPTPRSAGDPLVSPLIAAQPAVPHPTTTPPSHPPYVAPSTPLSSRPDRRDSTGACD